MLKISADQSLKLLAFLHEKKAFNLQFDAAKQRLDIFSTGPANPIIFNLPLSFPKLDQLKNLPAYLENFPEQVPDYLVILIQAGNSSLGYFRDGQVVHHKVIRKYMVRKKQGKAQITYLNKKGKSRAGSRVRLAATIEFFEEINVKLQEWLGENNPKKILISCPARLWGMLFESKTAAPFQKKDVRLQKVPLDVRIPNFDELKRVNRFAQGGTLHLETQQVPQWLDTFLG